MLDLLKWTQLALEHQRKVEFQLYHPNRFISIFPGTLVETECGRQRARSVQNLVDLANTVKCHIQLNETNKPWLTVTLSLIATEKSFHHTNVGTEKYGVHSEYANIDKFSDPVFITDFQRSCALTQLHEQSSVLNLGINTGDEFEFINHLYPNHTMTFTGVDHCPSAIERARQRFPHLNYTFHIHDINQLETLNLKKYDILMSLGTLHSPGIESKRVFMWLVQNVLQTDGHVIIGFPNCRWVDGHAVYGAKTKNKTESDLSLVIKDIYFIKKYLQQHKFNVTIFGKYYLFVVGVKHPPKR